MPDMDKPWHGCNERVPEFQAGLGDCVLETPSGTYVVRMVRGSEWGHWWHWSIIHQPAGQYAHTTSPRPSYYPGGRDASSYNDYHHALNYLEDRIYDAQQGG